VNLLKEFQRRSCIQWIPQRGKIWEGRKTCIISKLFALFLKSIAFPWKKNQRSLTTKI